MKITLTEIERNRLDKLLLLYQLECGDEDASGSAGNEAPTAFGVSAALSHQGIYINFDILEAILDQKLAISDELAESIEKEFMLSSGWMSS